MKPWIQKQIEDLEREHGQVPPPWVIFMEHPYSICWRMGGGEGHIIVWDAWWRGQALTEDQRLAYFRRWAPPHCWLHWMICAVWGEELGPDKFDFDDVPFFERLERLGFGSKADCQQPPTKVGGLYLEERGFRRATSDTIGWLTGSPLRFLSDVLDGS